MALTILWFGLLALCSYAYIPAVPTNDSVAIAAGLNDSDASMLALQWFPKGTYSEPVSYQLEGAESNGINKGALVHFSEVNLTDDTTTTPWIALVSCDANATDSTLATDIFTLAQARGAVAALLYSEWSMACLINPKYANPAVFDQIMDIFSTRSLSSSQLIESEFVAINQTLYRNFNATRLNDSAIIVSESLGTGLVPEPSYLYATLTAANAILPNSTAGATNNSPGTTSGGGSNNTDLAMIVLYVITGAVSVLFCVVILSGAIRAIRHPERYGPRAGDPTVGGAQGQSRARGLTRAIVDTFPIIKFSRTVEEDPLSGEEFKPADEESHGSPELPMEMAARDGAAARETTAPITEIDVTEWRDEPAHNHRHPLAGSTEVGSSSAPQSPSTHGPAEAQAHGHGDHGVPAAIGRQTCPICIVDFEEGDDLRVLPCEGKHVFHQQCVDPWLLELSSSCPICRQDFQALESMIAGGAPSDEQEEHPTTSSFSPSTSHPTSRFSRYLKFVHGRRNEDRESLDDPTDPPFPIADNTSL